MNYKMILAICSISLSLYYCQANVDHSTTTYRDIDLLQLEGVGAFAKTDSITYPNFQIIEAQPNERVLIVNYTKKNGYKLIFTKEKGYWFNVSSFYDEGEGVYHQCHFTYIFEDRIVKLKYGYNIVGSYQGEYDLDTVRRIEAYDPRLHHLDEISIMNPAKRVVYYFNSVNSQPELKISASSDLAQSAETLPFYSKSVDNFFKKDDLMCWETKNTLKNDQLNFADSTCFESVDKFGYRHNIFWNAIYMMGDMVE